LTSTGQQEFKFYDGLFEEILSLENLNEAFRKVKSNKGAPGIDGVTVEKFAEIKEKEIVKLKQEVENWTYKPSPVKRVEIPKPNGGVRLLGIPTVRDRTLQFAIKQKLEPIYEPLFSDNSYGFRPGRSQEQAITKARDMVASGKEHVIDMDLSKFFDRINHDRLINRLGETITDKRILRLIGITLRSGIMDKGELIPSEEGTVQGSPLSPLLSNIVLDELDKELEKRGLEFCRFADDCNIFVKSEKAALRVKESITRYVEKKLKLKVNEEKTKVGLSKFVKFLGMTILGVGICISCKSMEKAMDKVKELTPRRTHNTIEQQIEKINEWYQGWSGYYKMTNYPSQLYKIEAHIRRRLRALLIRNQKRRRNLFNKFVKSGVAVKMASKAVFSNKNIWALSITKATHNAYPNKWFIDKLGQFVMSDKNLEHWFNFKDLPKLS
jgi:RNA-directed DNA polymerase